MIDQDKDARLLIVANSNEPTRSLVGTKSDEPAPKVKIPIRNKKEVKVAKNNRKKKHQHVY